MLDSFERVLMDLQRQLLAVRLERIKILDATITELTAIIKKERP